MSNRATYRDRKHRSALLLFVLVIAFSCLMPSFAYADECPAGGYHVFRIDIITPATTSSDGLSLYTCKKCGYQEYVTVDSTGHEWSDWYTVQEPTCTSEGIEERVCTKHPQNVHYEQRTIPALSSTGNHEFTETGRTEPTCTEAGSVTYTCSVCGYSYTDTLAATGHAWGPWIVDVEPSATKEGGSLVLHDGSEHRVCANDPSHQETQAIPATADDLAASSTESQRATHGGATTPEEVIEDEPAHRFFAEDFFTAGPNRLDVIVLGLDAAVAAVTSISSLSLIYTSIWIHKRRKEAAEKAAKRLAKRNATQKAVGMS